MMEPVINNLPGIADESAEKLAGQLLKNTRESKRITLEEVAERLHLDIEIIKSLESDNYSALPGSAYIKGYLRSYAGLLGIPLAELSYTEKSLTNNAQLLPENINYTNETTVKKLSYFWISAVLLFILAIFSSLIQVDDTDIIERENIQPNIAVTEETIQSAQIPVNDINIKSDKSELPVTVKSQDIKTAKAESKPLIFSGLIMEYKKNSWTEVYDLNGKKLVYGMIKQGEKIQVDGLQPYSVLLGNADAVDIKFGGEDFSLTKYTRNGMAQFVIGSTFNNK